MENDQIIKCNKDPVNDECGKDCKLFKECWEQHMKFEVRIPFFIVDKFQRVIIIALSTDLLYRFAYPDLRIEICQFLVYSHSIQGSSCQQIG